MTVARPLAALATAMITGGLVTALERLGWASEPDDASLDADDCCEDDHHHLEDIPSDVTGWGRIGVISRRSFSYAFGPLMDDLTPWLILGLLISGLIILAVPDHFFLRSMYHLVGPLSFDAGRWHADLYMRCRCDASRRGTARQRP